MPPGAVASWRRVLFIRTDRLGETVLALPAILALKAALPESEITVLVQPGLRGLIQRIHGVREVWEYPSGPRGLWWFRALRWGAILGRGGFNAVFVSNPMKELHLAAALSSIPVRVGYGRKWGSCLTHRMLDERMKGKKHEVESNLDLIRFAGVPVDQVPAASWGLEAEERDVAAILARQGIDSGRPFLAVHPFASHPKKEWLSERYVAFIREVYRLHRLAVVMVGQSAKGTFQYDAVLRECSGANLVAQLTLPQLAALLKRAAALVSSDSGPVHLAAAVGTPTVALFGTTEDAAGPARWGPWGSKHAVIWKPSMEGITVGEVLKSTLAYVR